MEEQLRNVASEINKRIESDGRLVDLLNSYEGTLLRIKELNGQIERSPRADQVNQILSEIHLPPGRRRTSPIYIGFMGRRIDVRPYIETSLELISKLTGIIRLP
jgi:hypothetical protein